MDKIFCHFLVLKIWGQFPPLTRFWKSPTKNFPPTHPTNNNAFFIFFSPKAENIFLHYYKPTRFLGKSDLIQTYTKIFFFLWCETLENFLVRKGLKLFQNLKPNLFDPSFGVDVLKEFLQACYFLISLIVSLWREVNFHRHQEGNALSFHLGNLDGWNF